MSDIQQFYIIGMSDDNRLSFPAEVDEIIAKGKVFSGGKRHHELVTSLLPEKAVWIDITVPIKEVFQKYEGIPEIVVFASGDPLFFGFANTVRRELPNAKIILYPTFNSLQMLAHRLVIPYQEMRSISLTGRPWDKFDAALIEGEMMIGLLTDREKTPSAIAERMLYFGYDNYRITVGEELGNKDKERIRSFYPHEMIHETFNNPNCMILERTVVHPRPFGIPETAFHLLDGRAKMITKMPIRLLTLSMLELRTKESFWDIGFCTGSVSIEAKLQFPQLHVTSFEQREEGRELMEMNSRKFGTPGIQMVIGDFLSCDLSSLTAPDAVFIGGHGGKLIEMLAVIDKVLRPGGCIVFNSVSEESLNLFHEGVGKIGRQIVSNVRITVDQNNTIEIIKAQ
jgi:precorrin-6Y C5,15-methyltransferase (decarboxylating)